MRLHSPSKLKCSDMQPRLPSHVRVEQDDEPGAVAHVRPSTPFTGPHAVMLSECRQYHALRLSKSGNKYRALDEIAVSADMLGVEFLSTAAYCTCERGRPAWRARGQRSMRARPAASALGDVGTASRAQSGPPSQARHKASARRRHGGLHAAAPSRAQGCGERAWPARRAAWAQGMATRPGDRRGHGMRRACTAGARVCIPSQWRSALVWDFQPSEVQENYSVARCDAGGRRRGRAAAARLVYRLTERALVASLLRVKR